MSYFRLFLRGAAWGCLASLLGSMTFVLLVLVPMVFRAASQMDYPDPIYIARDLILFSGAGGLLSVIPSVILGTIGGIVLNLLVQSRDSIRASSIASVSLGALVGLVTTSLIIVAYIFGLGLVGLGRDILLLVVVQK